MANSMKRRERVYGNTNLGKRKKEERKKTGQVEWSFAGIERCYLVHMAYPGKKKSVNLGSQG